MPGVPGFDFGERPTTLAILLLTHPKRVQRLKRDRRSHIDPAEPLSAGDQPARCFTNCRLNFWKKAQNVIPHWN